MSGAVVVSENKGFIEVYDIGSGDTNKVSIGDESVLYTVTEGKYLLVQTDKQSIVLDIMTSKVSVSNNVW